MGCAGPRAVGVCVIKGTEVENVCFLFLSGEVLCASAAWLLRDASGLFPFGRKLLSPAGLPGKINRLVFFFST